MIKQFSKTKNKRLRRIKILRNSGLTLISLSILLSFSSLSKTGAIIGISKYFQTNLFPIVLLIIGLIAVLSSATLEKRLNEPLPLEEIRRIARLTVPEGSSYIFDTSFVITYKDKQSEALFDYIGGLKSQNNSFVPEEILEELGGKNRRYTSPMKDKIESLSLRPSGYKPFMKLAIEALNQGSKAYTRDIVKDVILGNSEEPTNKWDIDFKIYDDAMRVINRSLDEKNIPKTSENILKENDRIYDVTIGDASIIASAIAQTRKGKYSLILGQDKDFGEAVSYLRSAKGIQNIIYLNTQGEAI